MRLHSYIFSPSENLQQISIKFDVDFYTESCSANSFWPRSFAEPTDLTLKNFSLWDTRSSLKATRAYALDENTGSRLAPCALYRKSADNREVYILLRFIINIRVHLKSVYFSLYVNIFTVYKGWSADICPPSGVLNKVQVLRLGQFKRCGIHSRTQLSLLGKANVNYRTPSIFRNVMFFSEYQAMEKLPEIHESSSVCLSCELYL